MASRSSKSTVKKALKQRKKRASVGIKWWHIALLLIAGLTLVVLIKHSFIFMLAGMLPSIVALIVDRSHRKDAFKTVTSMNLAGVLPYLYELWLQGNTVESVQNMVGQMEVWLVIYAAAGAGWIMTWFGPRASQVVMEMVALLQTARLEASQKHLVDEWGPEIKRQ